MDLAGCAPHACCWTVLNNMRGGMKRVIFFRGASIYENAAGYERAEAILRAGSKEQ